MNSGFCIILERSSPIKSMKIMYSPTADPSWICFGTSSGHLLLLNVHLLLNSKILRHVDKKVTVCHIHFFHHFTKFSFHILPPFIVTCFSKQEYLHRSHVILLTILVILSNSIMFFLHYCIQNLNTSDVTI